MSCRRGAKVPGASRHSIWRWRMAIINALKPEADDSLVGIVEGCHRSRGGLATPPPGGCRAWEKKLLAATDRAGHRAFEGIADAGQAAISFALLPVMAPDAVLCTDGFVTCERIAKDARIPHFALTAGRGTKRTRAATSSHCQRPDRPGPRLHAALLRACVKDPCSISAAGAPHGVMQTAPAWTPTGCCSLQALAPTRFTDTALMQVLEPQQESLQFELIN